MNRSQKCFKMGLCFFLLFQMPINSRKENIIRIWNLNFSLLFWECSCKTVKLPPSDDKVPASGMFNPEFRIVGGVGVFDASTGRSSDNDDCERVSKPSIGFTGFISISSFDWESMCGRPTARRGLTLQWRQISHTHCVALSDKHQTKVDRDYLKLTYCYYCCCCCHYCFSNFYWLG